MIRCDPLPEDVEADLLLRLRGMNCKTGSYQPGFDAFPADYRLEHIIRWWAIGDATNKR